MAESQISITPGTGENVSTFTRGDGRKAQIVCLGDPASGEAPIDPTAGLAVHLVPFATGGCSVYHAVSAGSTNAVRIKNGAGKIYGINISNRAAYPVYAKLHNSAASPPTAGSGVVYTCGVQSGVDRHVPFPNGLVFSTGIGITIVKLIADNDATAVLASDCVVDVEWI